MEDSVNISNNAVRRMKLISFVVWMLLLLAACVSATHIVSTAHKLRGLPHNLAGVHCALR